MKCVRCPLGQGREDNNYEIVWHDGSPSAKIMIVGEAPGKEEAETGKPFVGRAGKKLRSILKDFVDLKKDVFITNTVLCRPPDNRNPEISEQDACFPHLEAMFFTIKPRLVMTVGRVSSDWLLRVIHKEYNIYEMKEVTWGGHWFLWLPLYHPSYLLRKPTAVGPFVACLQRYKGILDKLRTNDN